MEKKAWKHYGTRGKKRTSFSFRAICIAFIFFTILGCVIALLWQQGQDDTMGEMITRAQQPQSFWWVFQKYAKYLALLFLGGECLGGTVLIWFVLLFRGISVGYSSMALILALGKAQGTIAILFGLFPQNLLLVPAVLFMGWTALSYGTYFHSKREGKAGLVREKYREQAEFLVLFFCCLILTAIGALWESLVTPGLLTHFLA